MNVSRHDSNFAFAWRNYSRAVRPDQTRAAGLQELPRADHIQDRNAFGDADNQFNLSIRGFHDRVGGKRWRNENHGSVRAGFVHRFLNSVEDRKPFVRGTALAGSDPAHDLRPILRARLRVKRPFAAGETLHDYACRFIYENAQALFKPQGLKPENCVLRKRHGSSHVLRRIAPLCGFPLCATLCSLWLEILLAAS